MLVSILVMMDLPFWRKWTNFSIISYCVSILVMMDLPFWLERLGLVKWQNTKVSILVMMDLPFWLYSIWVSFLIAFQFQSLLWWICLFDLNACSCSAWIFPSCFNPCYDGFAFLTSWSFLKHHTKHVSILVMMDLPFWLYHFAWNILVWSCFNPCYDGFAFLTYGDNITKIQPGTVSILVMMDLPFWQLSIKNMSKVLYSFNPCYDGFAFLTATKTGKTVPVSINFSSIVVTF